MLKKYPVLEVFHVVNAADCMFVDCMQKGSSCLFFCLCGGCAGALTSILVFLCVLAVFFVFPTLCFETPGMV